MDAQLQKKVDRAIRLLRQIPTDNGTIELSYSGGKDSDVILELAKMSGIPFEAIYKNTTIDPSGTIKHCKDKGVTIVNPKKTFFEIIEESGFPNRWSRFCCKYLKEYKIHNHAIQGIRRCESVKRASRYKEPQVCRIYNKNDRASIYLPILEWTDKDVEEFIKERNIQCHPLYYTNGVFDVKKRLGCQGCPLQSRQKRLEFFKNNPKWLRAWCKAGQKWFETHPNASSHKYYDNMYERMYQELFCNNYAEFHEQFKEDTLFEQVSAKDRLEEIFKIDLSLPDTPNKK